MRTDDWEHFEHQADLGIRGRGATVETAFENAALAMTAVVADIDRVRPMDLALVECGVPDVELLLVDWLNAVLFQMSTRRMLFCSFKVRIGPDFSLHAQLRGERIDPARHGLRVEVKAATYSQLLVGQGSDGRWTAQCIVDV